MSERPETNAEILARWQANTAPIYRHTEQLYGDSPPPIDFGAELQQAMQENEGNAFSRKLITNEHLPLLVDATVVGDEAATILFYTYWERRLLTFFLNRDPQHAEDLTQLTLANIHSNLLFFEKRGDGSFVKSLHSFCFTIARNTSNDYFSHKAERIQTQQLIGIEQAPEDTSEDDAEEQEERTKKYWDAFKDKIQEIVTPDEWEVIRLSVDKKTNREIADSTGRTERNVNFIMTDARGKVEVQLLSPHGLQPLYTFVRPDLTIDTLQNAARRGNINAIKIMKRWYTTADEFNEFSEKRNPQAVVPSKDVLSATRRFGNIVLNGINDGLPVAEIARQLERSESLVYQITAQLKREGLLSVETKYAGGRQQKKKDYSEFDSKVKALRDQGLKLDHIASELGVSYSSVSRSVDRLLRAGQVVFAAERTVPSKYVLNATRRYGDFILQGKLKGLSVEEIATQLKRSSSLVYQVVAQLKREGRLERKPR